MLYYSYDGSFEGFLSVIYQIFLDRLPNCSIIQDTKPVLFKKKFVSTEQWRCLKVEKKLVSIDKGLVFKKIFYAFHSKIEGTEDLILKYVKQTLRQESPTNDVSIEISKLSLTVSRESHSWLGFVRFEELKDGTLYSGIEPKYDVLPMISGHFYRRLKGKKWIIYDIKRKYAASNSNGKLEFIEVETEKLPSLSQKEVFNQNLWKEFFSSISISERKNLNLQEKMIPQRYRKHLTEMKF